MAASMRKMEECMMKKLVVIALASAALIAPAMAADLSPAPRPIYKAPPPPPVWSWTGWYIGSNFGWIGSTDNNITNTGTDTGTAGLGSMLAVGCNSRLGEHETQQLHRRRTDRLQLAVGTELGPGSRGRLRRDRQSEQHGDQFVPRQRHHRPAANRLRACSRYARYGARTGGLLWRRRRGCCTPPAVSPMAKPSCRRPSPARPALLRQTP